MRKERLSSIDLSWMIFERMREEVGVGDRRGMSVAVVSDSKLGWRAVLEGRGADTLVQLQFENSGR